MLRRDGAWCDALPTCLCRMEERVLAPFPGGADADARMYVLLCLGNLASTTWSELGPREIPASE